MNKIFRIGLSVAAVIFVSACNDAEYGVGGVHAFLNEGTLSAGVNGTVVSLGETGADYSLTVTLTDRYFDRQGFRGCCVQVCGG